MHGNMPRNIRPATVRNRILYVLSVHGVEQTTAQSIFYSLTTGNDPMPEGVPSTFTFQGTELVWPAGVGTRVLRDDEVKSLNRALKANGNEPLDSECCAFEARRAYTSLHHKTQWEGYVDPTSQKAQMDALVQEACEPLDNVLCGHKKPGGRLTCMEDNHHGGLHKNGKHAWNELVVVEHHAPAKVSIKAKITKPKTVSETSELDRIMAELEALAL